MRAVFVCLATIIFSANLLYTQTTGINKYHILSDKVALTLEGGVTYTLADFKKAEYSYFGRLLGEYFFPSTQIGVWGLRGHATTGFLQGSGGASTSRPNLTQFKTTIISFGGGVEYLLSLSNVVMPYVYGGAAYLYYDPKDDNGNRLERNISKKYSRHEWSLIGEFGFRFLASENISVNLGANINYVNSDNLDDIIAGTDNDIFFKGFAGLSIYFGGTSDSDEDGIKDDDDLCPGTPQGVMVDQFGCPFDTDNDGVPDYLDKCLNTPAGILVDTDGCPVDSDGDGVPDYLDLCKDTPAGVPIDTRGCPFDEDEDGVPDYRDKCPGTPTGMEVNKFGCQLEIFKKELPELTATILTSGANFDVGKSNLLPGAKIELDKLVAVMIKHPETRWNIDGHTDNTGSYSLNKRLSYERALSVANYFVLRGIDRARLEINGLGPDYPVAENTTESGRAMNRRVAITLIDKDVKSQPPLDIEYDVKSERHVGNMIFTDGNQYCVQVSSFRNRQRAENELRRLQDLGENAFIVKVNLPQLDGIWHRVRIGYFNTLSEAMQRRGKVVR